MEQPAAVPMLRFVMEDVDLDEAESEHVLDCRDCQAFVFQLSAVLDELERGHSKAARARHKTRTTRA